MLKKFLTLLGLTAAFAVNANALSQDSENCYLIGTADELKEFAGIVNGTSNFAGCGKLTADIYYLGNAKLLNDERTGLREENGSVLIPAEEQSWTPLNSFAGTFDGDNHTIYGLYAKGSGNIGFVGSVTGEATIKNLRISDSYFESAGTCSAGDNKGCTGSAGGFVGSHAAKSGKLTLSLCGFLGVVKGSEDGANGGLIGALTFKSSIDLLNSYNEGNVFGGGGLIGYVLQNAEVEVDNSYNAGSFTTNAIIGKRVSNGKFEVSGNNLGCFVSGVDSAAAIASCTANFSSAEGVTFVGESAEEIVANYWYNLYGKVADDDEGEDGGDDSTGQVIEMNAELKELIDSVNKNAQGLLVKIDTVEINGANIEVSVATLTLDDKVEELIMPNNLQVYGVKYERTFSQGGSTLCDGGYNVSTIVLPFTMETDVISGGIFYRPVELKPVDGGDWAVGLERVVGKVEAHTPYIVCPTAEKLTFKYGENIVIEQANASVAKTTNFERRSAIEPETFVDGETWDLVGLYKTKKFSRECPEEVTEEPCEAGRVYAFKNGSFVRIGNGSSAILRAYILAPEGAKPERVAAFRVSNESVVKKEDSISPDQLLVEILHTDEDKYFRAVPLEEWRKEEFRTDEETTKIKLPHVFPLRGNHGPYWYDMKGRNMNRKPSAKGVYLNNNVPFVVR